jgi:4-amino-4-deoxy-L-arabinose transferase-like glycosyltransferase
MVHPPTEDAVNSRSLGSHGLTPRALALLAAILAVHVVLNFLLHANFDHDYDAQHYARIAHEIRAGSFEIALHPFTQRFAVTVPTAAAYALLGVSELSTTLWPLAASLASIALVFALALRLFGRTTALLSSFLLATNLVQVKFSSRLLPDIVVSLFLLAGLVCLTHARTCHESRRQRWDGLLCALALTGAFLAKSTFFWSLPFFLAVLVRDLFRREHLRFWLWFALAGLACAATYFGAYYAATGDALYRLEGIETTHNIRAWSYASKSTDELLARLTYEPARYIVGTPGYGLLVFMSLPALYQLLRPSRVLPRETRWIAGYFAIVFLAFWFGTTSVVAYNPLPISERFLMPLLAPLCILSGVTIRGLVLRGGDTSEKRLSVFMLVGAFLVSAALVVPVGVRRSLLYGAFLLFTLALVMHPFAGRFPDTQFRRRIKATGILLLFLAPLLNYATRGDPDESPPLLELERKVFSEQLADLAGPTVIVTDAQSAFVLPFYFGFDVPGEIHIVDWSDESYEERFASYRTLMYIHQPRLIAMNENWGQEIPDFALVQPAGWKVIDAQSIDGEHWVLLCEVDPAGGTARDG